MTRRADVQANVIAVGLPPIDVGDAYDLEDAIDTNRDAVQRILRRLSAADVVGEQCPNAVVIGAWTTRDSVLRAAECFAEPRCIEGLEQIIDGVNVERAHSVLVERRNEDDCRRRLSGELSQNGKSIEVRHLDIEKEKLRLPRDRLLDGITAARTRGDHFRFARLLDEAHESASSQFFVVSNDDG
jgi:hypothetical protein